jgi:hypothetical protein
VKRLISSSVLLVFLLSVQSFAGVCGLQCDLGIRCSSPLAGTVAGMDHCPGHMTTASTSNGHGLKKNCTGQCNHQEIVAIVKAAESGARQLAHSSLQTYLSQADVPSSPVERIAARYRLGESDPPTSRQNSVLNLRV